MELKVDQQLLLGASTAAVVLMLTIIIYCKYVRARVPSTTKPSANIDATKKVVVLFIDAPDPDNPACAAAIVKHIINQDEYKVNPHLHIVLTGRQIDLTTSKLELYKQNNSIVRQPWEKNQPLHAEKVLEDSATRISGYLEKCNIETSGITIYDGGVAPYAPMSDRAHDWDFLFDRKDLITRMKADKGEILTPTEYTQLVEDFCGMEEGERVERLLAILRPYKFTPLSSLKDILEQATCSKIILFLGGPATALVQLFGGEAGSKLRPKVSGLYGMFGSLTRGRRTIFQNQFNVGCDVEAACELFINNMFPLAEKYLIPTETAKNVNLMLSSSSMVENGLAPYFIRLQKLWESTHKGVTQPMFDVLPVMAFTTQYREGFMWSRKKAVMQEVIKKGAKFQTFTFADSQDERHILVSEAKLDTLTRKDLLLFLQTTWSQTSTTCS